MKCFIALLLLVTIEMYSQDDYRLYRNNINLPLNNHGVIADVNISPGGSGGIFEEGSFLFSGGFVLSGYNGDTIWTNAVASSLLIGNYLPGNVGSDPADPANDMYVFNKEQQPFTGSWLNWQYAVEKGADYYDGNLNGIYDPVDLNGNGLWDPNEDRPDILGDETAWCIFNDSEMPRGRYSGVNPMGIEIKQTAWAYYSSLQSPVNNIVFFRYEINNSGTVAEVFNSVYFSLWADPDVGRVEDDLAGCDTLLQAGFTYNNDSDAVYGTRCPAFFTAVLQGPKIYIPGETFIDINSNGIYDPGIDTPLDSAYNRKGQILGEDIYPGAKNDGLSAFTITWKAWPGFNDPTDQYEARNLMMGFDKSGNPVDPCSYTPTGVHGGVNCNEINPLFWCSGDPESDYGWIDETGWDKRTLQTTGPFRLKTNEPVPIVIAYIIGRGSSSLNSVTVAKHYTEFARTLYDHNFDDDYLVDNKDNRGGMVESFQLYQNYPNPFNPSTRIRYQVPESGFVSLIIYDLLGRETAQLVKREQNPGIYEVEFNTGSALSALASGIYFYKLAFTGMNTEYSQVKKMLLIK